MLKGSRKAWEGAKHSADNAEMLLNASRLISQTGNFGLARSLSILSTEESAKSLALIIKSGGLEKTAHPISSYFKSHKVKHEAGIIYYALIQFSRYIIKIINEIESNSDISKERYFSLLAERLQADATALTQSETDPFEMVKIWFSSADESKQRGLYVSFLDGKWKTPKDISAADFEETVKVAEELIFILKLSFEYLNHSIVKQAYKDYLVENAANKSSQPTR